MTVDGLAGELPIGVILALCDRLLGEVGRRSHRFAWLRAPGGGADAWLPVEGYYPRHRLVVVCRPEAASYDHLFAERGLRLLHIDPSRLGGDPASAEQMVRRMIARLPAPAGREDEPDGRPRLVKPARGPRLPSASPPARGPRLPSASPPARGPGLPSASPPTARPEARRDRPPDPPRPARVAALRSGTGTAATWNGDAVAGGVLAGVALAVVCGAELILAVIPVALDSGRVVLGLGLALDACARLLGALDASRVGKTGWAWACAIIGSPAVLAAARLRPRPRRPRHPGRPTGPGEQSEATPPAALMAAVALLCILVGLVL